MNHKASIYANPIIPGGLYYAKLIDLYVEREQSPYIWASLMLSPAYGEHAGALLSSILYVTPQSQTLVAKFKSTFCITGADTIGNYQQSIGLWGCVSVVPRTYLHDDFSCVVYVTQNRQMRQIADKLRNDEENGRLDWS